MFKMEKDLEKVACSREDAFLITVIFTSSSVGSTILRIFIIYTAYYPRLWFYNNVYLRSTLRGSLESYWMKDKKSYGCLRLQKIETYLLLLHQMFKTGKSNQSMQKSGYRRI